MVTINNPQTDEQGFTLVELIIVIVILGILAVSVGPRFFGDQAVKEATLAAQSISLLRLQQQRAMQDTLNPCYGVQISAAQVSPNDCGAAANADRQLAIPPNVIVVVQSPLAGAGSSFLFNALGCPVSSNHSTVAEECGQGSVELQFNGSERRSICVQSQGFIRDGVC